MWNCPATPPVIQPLLKVASGALCDLLDCDGRGFLHLIEYVGELRVFRRRVGSNNVPERWSFRRRGFGVERGNVKLSKVSGNVAVAFLHVPPPQIVPVASCKILLRQR